MSIYLDRFLNMPAQRIPETNGKPIDGPALLDSLHQRMDVRHQVEEVAELVSQHVSGGGESEALLAELGQVMLREDSEFHSFQIVDAAFKQFDARLGSESGRHVLIGMARFLAAHSPTPRAVGQTYQIALRLHRGEEIYRED
jgi:hypothetical protein